MYLTIRMTYWTLALPLFWFATISAKISKIKNRDIVNEL